jgi:hypothetical protein
MHPEMNRNFKSFIPLLNVLLKFHVPIPCRCCNNVSYFICSPQNPGEDRLQQRLHKLFKLPKYFLQQKLLSHT